MALVSRPSQGANSLKPFGRPRPAYKPATGLSVLSSGTLSQPKSPGARFNGTRQVADATPTIITL